jgi:hypothetical protein
VLALLKGGHLELIQWAVANGCPRDNFTCQVAAYEGHLEAPQWAWENGFPWVDRERDLRVAKNHIKEWAKEAGIWI